MPYLDHCATTPLDPEVRSAMDSVRLAAWGNPSSVHASGRKSRAVLSESRARIAQVLRVSPPEIVFTSSASEANNLAIKGAVLRQYPEPFHLIVSAIEHDSVLRASRYLAARFDWVRLTEIAPDEGGRIDPAAVEAACRKGASLVSVMMVNNETGIQQPVQEIAQISRRHGALFHTDATQAVGRIEIAPRDMDCDFLTASSHKIYGPRGMGLLCIKEGTKLDAGVHGGLQEGGRRAGTEDVAGAAGFARAFELAWDGIGPRNMRLAELEKAFMARLLHCNVSFDINGALADKVSGVVNLSISGIQSSDLVIGMDLAGFAISAGSACSSGVIEPSHVLKAMSLEPWRIEGGIRISFGKDNQLDDARDAAQALADLAARLQSAPQDFKPRAGIPSPGGPTS